MPAATVAAVTPSETPGIETTPTLKPAATASPEPSPAQTPAITVSATAKPVASLPEGITQEAAFTADLDGDGSDETIVAGSAGDKITVYVLYAGGYHKADLPEGTFRCAYMTRTSGGKHSLLVSVDEASEDYITLAFSFSGRKPVWQGEVAGYVCGVNKTQITLSGHIDVIGTWDYTREFNLQNDFTLEQGSDYLIIENRMEPLHTIRELPVEILTDGAYTADSLPAGTVLQPVLTDASGYMSFRLEDGSEGRILFTREEHVEAYIDGMIESEYFDNIAYSD